MNDDLITLARCDQRDSVMQRALGDESQRIGLLLAARGGCYGAMRRS